MTEPHSELRGGRRLDALTAILACLAARHPRLAFTLASSAGAVRNRITSRWPAGDEVRALFPELSHRRAVRIAAAIGALEERNDVLIRSVRRDGIGSVRPLVAVSGALRSLEAPCILVTFHVGAIHITSVALEALDKPVLAFRHGAFFTPRPPIVMESTEGSEQQRAAAFITARQYLKLGRFVVMALDAAPGATIVTECLGRPLALARGAFALAGMTRAPIVPITVRWTRQGAQADIDIPLAPAEPSDSGATAAVVELALARAASSWLERYLRESPDQLSLGLLRELLYGVNIST